MMSRDWCKYSLDNCPNRTGGQCDRLLSHYLSTKLGRQNLLASTLFTRGPQLTSTKRRLVGPRRRPLLRKTRLPGAFRRAVLLPAVARGAEVEYQLAPTAPKEAPDLGETSTQGGPENRIRFLDNARRTCDTPPWRVADPRDRQEGSGCIPGPSDFLGGASLL